MTEQYVFDGYHHRAKKLLEECRWHLCNPSASNAMPVHWDAHRLNVLNNLEAFIKEFDTEQRKQEEASPDH